MINNGSLQDGITGYLIYLITVESLECKIYNYVNINDGSLPDGITSVLDTFDHCLEQTITSITQQNLFDLNADFYFCIRIPVTLSKCFNDFHLTHTVTFVSYEAILIITPIALQYFSNISTIIFYNVLCHNYVTYRSIGLIYWSNI